MEKKTATIEEKPPETRHEGPSKRSIVEDARKRDMELVKGVFRFPEVQGGMVELIYRGHRGQAPKKYTFFDGQEYEIPRGLADHINESCCYFQHGNIMDAAGKPLVDRRHKRIERMNFSRTIF